jgi:hypothetical protein
MCALVDQAFVNGLAVNSTADGFASVQSTRPRRVFSTRRGFAREMILMIKGIFTGLVCASAFTQADSYFFYGQYTAAVVAMLRAIGRSFGF